MVIRLGSLREKRNVKILIFFNLKLWLSLTSHHIVWYYNFNCKFKLNKIERIATMYSMNRQLVKFELPDSRFDRANLKVFIL